MSRISISFLSSFIMLACGLSFYPREKDKRLEGLDQRQRLETPPAPQDTRFALADRAAPRR